MEEEIVEAVIFGDISKVERLIANGADISLVSIETSDGRRPPIEFASFDNNFDLLFILWKAKAKPTTPYLEDIFVQFSKGKSPSDLANELNTDPEEYLEINGNFSVKKMPFEKATFHKGDGIFNLILKFSNFKFKDQKVIPILEFNIEKEIENVENIDLTFDPDECTSSLLIFDSHNPVDLKWLKINTDSKNKTALQAELFFDFEHENTGLKNQTLHLKTKIDQA